MRGRSTAPAAETPPPRRRGHAAWAWHNKAGAWPGPTPTTGLERVPAAAEAPPGRDRRFGGGGGGGAGAGSASAPRLGNGRFQRQPSATAEEPRTAARGRAPHRGLTARPGACWSRPVC